MIWVWGGRREGGKEGMKEKSELAGNNPEQSFAVAETDVRKCSFPFQVSLIIGNFGKGYIVYP